MWVVSVACFLEETKERKKDLPTDRPPSTYQPTFTLSGTEWISGQVEGETGRDEIE